MKSITTTCLIDLAFDLSVDWKTLARVLGLSEEVSRICDDYRRNVFEQAYRMLQTWKRRNGSQATYQALGEALSHDVVSRNDLAQKYCAGRNRSSLDEGKRLKSFRSLLCSASSKKSGEIYEELRFLTSYLISFEIIGSVILDFNTWKNISCLLRPLAMTESKMRQFYRSSIRV